MNLYELKFGNAESEISGGTVPLLNTHSWSISFCIRKSIQILGFFQMNKLSRICVSARLLSNQQSTSTGVIHKIHDK